MVEAVKIKAMVILSLLIIAIGVPAVYYASTVKEQVNNPPVAIITGPSEGYVNKTIEFSAANSIDDGYILTYLWDFGDGTKSAGKIVTHSYSKPGNYTVTLVVYDNEGAYSSATKNIVISPLPTRETKVSVDELLGNVSAYIGRQVKVYGVFAYGRNYSFYMVNESGYKGLRVYVEYGAPRPERMEYGDVLEVSGRFTLYKNELEIKVENSTGNYVRIIGSGGTNSYKNISFSEWGNYNNSFVHLRGVITEVYASYKFFLGEIGIYVEINGNSFGTMEVGDEVEAQGFLTYYKPKNASGYNELIIRANTNDYVKDLTVPNYINTSIATLLSNPNNYENKSVHTWGIIAWLYQNKSSNFTLFGLYWNGSEIKVVGFNGSNVGYLQEGYYADVYGEFTSYNGSWEIKIRPNSYDKVIAKPQEYMDVNITNILNNPENYNNTLVHVPYAKVKNVYASWLFWVSNSTENEQDITIYVEIGGVVNGSPYFGSTVEIWGMVTEYNGSWEIKIRNATEDRVDVVSSVNYTIVSMDELLTNASDYNNTLVYVPRAVVVSVYNASWLFWVSNDTSNSEDMSVYVEKGANITAEVYVGAQVRIWGMVTQYNGEWEIKIRANTEDNVELISSEENYTEVPIEKLLTNASDYNNTLVHVPNATVVSVYASYLFWVSNDTTNSQDIAVYVESGVSVPSVGVGDIVEIYGNVTYYNGTYEIRIRYGTPDKVVLISTSAKYVNFSYIHEVDDNGNLLHKGENVIVNGTVLVPPSVYSYTTSSGDRLKFYIEGDDGGVLIFGFLNYSQLNLNEGDVVQVRGMIDQYAGEAEIKVSNLRYITVINHTTPVTPKNLTTGFFSNWREVERIEGTLVKVNGTVTDKYVGSSFVKITIDDGSGPVTIFMYNSWGIDTSNISVGDNITVVGIVSQHDTDDSDGLKSGYEILPRYQSDIIKEKSRVRKGDENNDIFASIDGVLKWKIDIVLTVEDMWAR